MAQTFGHKAQRGDLIYALPTVAALGGGVVCICEPHVCRDMRTLLERQPYVEGVRCLDGAWRGLRFDVNLNQYGAHPRINDQHLALSHLEAQSASFDLTSPWLFNIEPRRVAPIVVHRSDRYKHQHADYSALRGFEDRTALFGTDREHAKFEKRTGLTVQRHHLTDGLGFASAVLGADLFIGNQSLGFALAEAMKVPRFLEQHDPKSPGYIPKRNCRPEGPDGYASGVDDEPFGLTRALIERYAGPSQ